MLNFFILQNTQSGKLSLTAKEMKKWEKTVVFFISSNDRTLADQSAECLSYFLDRKVYVLSSHHNEHIQAVKESLSSFPVITALANKQQNARVLELAWDCYQQNLKYAFVFDEADTTYPVIRDQSCLLNGEVVNYHSLFQSAYRVGFVSATEGVLSSEDYPECAHAELLPVKPDTEYYRAIHTRDAILHEVPGFTGNNEYALGVLKKYHSHFFKKSPYGYRKIILNSNSQTSDMEAIARECVGMGMNAIIFNMNGLTVLRSGDSIPEISIRGKRFNQTLFDTVEQYSLDDRPLVIIGRRKVDRGLSFHYAPRDGSRGLVWTDIILGEISDVSLAVQKAGRMAGIIAHCPQYSGECHYWAPSETLDKCVTKNRINDQANLSRGTLSETLQIATREVERFVEYITVSPSEMQAYREGREMALSERLEYYTNVVSGVREQSGLGIRLSGNTVRIQGNTFHFYHGLQLDPRADIPFVIQLSMEEMQEVMGSVMQRKLVVKELLRQKFSYLSSSLDSYTFLECRVVESLDFIVESSLCGRKVSIENTDESEDSYHILLHPDSCSMAMLVWNASRMKPVKRCDYILKKGKYAGLCCGKLCSEQRCGEHESKDEVYERSETKQSENERSENPLPEGWFINEDGEEEFVKVKKEKKYIRVINEDGEEELVKVK